MSKHETRTDVVQRLADLVLNRELGPNDYLKYEWHGGYETLEERRLNNSRGGLHFAGAHHPGDGLCHANDSDEPNGRDGTCVHCGKTLW